MAESLSFLLNMTAKDLFAILTSIEPQRILDCSIYKCDISTEFGGNVVVDFSHVGA